MLIYTNTTEVKVFTIITSMWGAEPEGSPGSLFIMVDGPQSPYQKSCLLLGPMIEEKWGELSEIQNPESERMRPMRKLELFCLKRKSQKGNLIMVFWTWGIITLRLMTVFPSYANIAKGIRVSALVRTWYRTKRKNSNQMLSLFNQRNRSLCILFMKVFKAIGIILCFMY